MDGVTEYVGVAAVAWLVGFAPLLEIFGSPPPEAGGLFNQRSVSHSGLCKIPPSTTRAFSR